ncbi:MAG: helix-turn-helix domain-containing protein [Halodesulfurarchaeum sp.]|nr:helix-turn-helix domain-containing protein [Halodesulfurarchaeum sp.]
MSAESPESPCETLSTFKYPGDQLPDNMPRVRIQTNGALVDDLLADVSTEFPEAEFNVLAALPTTDGLLDVVEVTTADGDDLVRHFERTPDIRSFEVIHIDDESVLVQFVIPVSETYDALVTSEIVPQQPVTLRDGWYTAEIVAPHERLSRYTEALAAADLPYRVISLTQDYETSELLTDRQWEFLTTAVERGFYETPRQCTLAELADDLDVNVSAVSRLRHRTESRIVSAFVAEAGP